MHRQDRFTAGPLTFTVKHELWDGNIQDHPDQGVAIMVTAEVAGKDDDPACGSTASTSRRAMSTGRKTTISWSPGRRCWAAWR